MGKKKNSTKHTSTPTRDTSEPADQESISTFSSDTASVQLDSTPLLALVSPEVDGPAASHDVLTILNNIQTQLGAIQSRLSKLEGSNLPESKSHIPSDQDSNLPSKLHSSDSTPLPSSDLSSNYRISNLESNVGDFNWDHVKHNMIDSPLRPSSPPLSTALLSPSTNLLDLSSADFFIDNVLLAHYSICDETTFSKHYCPHDSYPTAHFTTINYLFFFISTLATSNPCTWVTPQLRPPDPTVTKRGLLISGN